MVGFCVVKTVLTPLFVIGQQTPGKKSLLKQSESRKSARFSSNSGHTLKSSHVPGRPCGVIQRFSPSFP